MHNSLDITLPQQVLVRVLRCIRRLFGTLPALSCVYAVHVGNICRKWRVDHAVALRLFVVAVVCGICGRDGWPEVVMVLVVLPATDIAALNRLVAELNRLVASLNRLVLDGVFCEVRMGVHSREQSPDGCP